MTERNQDAGPDRAAIRSSSIPTQPRGTAPSPAAVDFQELKLDPARWLPGVLNTLDEQIQLAEQVEQISQRQSLLISEGQFELAAEMLADRQPLVERISEVSGRLDPLASRLGEVAMTLGEHDRGTLIERVGRLQGLLDAIQERDEQGRAAFDQERLRIGAEMAGLDRGRSAAAAYAGPSGSSPSFQDREG